MADDADETVDSTKDTTEEVANTEEVEDEVADTDSEDLGELQEKNKRLFERAKKAEAEAKLLKAERLKKEEQAKVEVKTDTSKKQDVVLTPMDAILLGNAKITEAEDIEEIVRYTNFQRLTNPTFQVKDALKDKTMITILRTRQEERTTAEATNTGGGRRGSTKLTPEQIIALAGQGKLPDDPEELAEARAALKRKK